MRRALCALMALALLAAPVAAKVVIINPRKALTFGGEDFQGHRKQQERFTLMVKSALEATGAREGTDFVIVQSKGAKTEFCRTGNWVWNYGTAGATAEQFDGVVYLGWPGSWTGFGGNATNNNLFRPDSLTLAARISSTGGLLVPQLAIMSNADGFCSSATLQDATNDTLGMTESGADRATTLYNLVGTPTCATATSYMSGCLRNETTPAGGLRVHIRGGAPPVMDLLQSSTNRAWADSSLSWPTTPDTLVMWERLMSHVSGSKPFVWVHPGGGGAPDDTLTEIPATTIKPTAENPIEVALMGLARLDSLTGGKVFGSKRIKCAIVVDRATSHGARLGAHGWAPEDSSSYYATLDSLAAMGVPITFAVSMDPDTLADHARELAKLRAMPLAHFTPQTWTGLDDTTALNAVPRWGVPVDVFGRYRQRAVYYADSANTGGGADSTIYAQLASSFWHADSLFGRGKVSRVVCAPDDDWTPLGVTGRNRAIVADSIAWVIGKLGLRGIRVNAQVPEANASVNIGPAAKNPRGYYNWQRRWTGSLIGGQKFSTKLLAHNGYSIAGGTWQTIPIFADGSGVDDVWDGSTSWEDNFMAETYRKWSGITQGRDWNADPFPRDNWVYIDGTYRPMADRFWPPVKANIAQFHASDLSGNPDGVNGAPARPGWWVIKSMVNAASIINHLAGRTIVEFCYPEDLEP